MKTNYITPSTKEFELMTESNLLGTSGQTDLGKPEGEYDPTDPDNGL